MRNLLLTTTLAAAGLAAAGMAASSSLAQQSPAAPSPPKAAAAESATLLVGKPAPAFTLSDQNDKPHSLAEAKGKWVVLAFYPKDETTGCTLQNKSYTAYKDKFAPANAVFYTISTQDTASKRSFCQKDALTHTLLADVGGSVSKAYGVYMDGPGVARRVTFYIRPDGTVADVDTHIRVATAAQDSLVRLASLESPGGGSGGAASAAAASTPPRVGDTIADFTLPDAATGASRSLKDLEQGQKAVALIFVSTQCPVSNAYNERMEQVATDYAAKGIRVVGINANSTESTAEVADHAKQHRLTFPILKDTGNRLADRLDAQVTPEVYVVAPSGTLLYHGPIDDRQKVDAVQHTYLRDALDAIAGGKTVVVKSARAFGCSIKRAPSATES